MAAETKNQTENGSLLLANESARLADLVSVAPGAIVSRVLARTGGGTVTIFAFAAGTGLSEHTAPFTALVQVVTGELEIVIGGMQLVVAAGQVVLMPAGVPHSLQATQESKMLLTMLRDSTAG